MLCEWLQSLHSFTFEGFNATNWPHASSYSGMSFSFCREIEVGFGHLDVEVRVGLGARMPRRTLIVERKAPGDLPAKRASRCCREDRDGRRNGTSTVLRCLSNIRCWMIRRCVGSRGARAFSWLDDRESRCSQEGEGKRRLHKQNVNGCAHLPGTRKEL